MTADAYGRPRSSRSLPTGPGSRGGTSGTAAYYRLWRLQHPEYRERERRRRLMAHAFTRLVRVLAGGPYERPPA